MEGVEVKPGLLILFIVVVVIMVILAIASSAQPEIISDEEINYGANETREQAPSLSQPTQGGNNTALDVAAQTQTGYWQGVWGNVQADPVMQDAAGNTFYNWSRFNVSIGEVYFTNVTPFTFDTSITNATDENISYAQSVYNWANTTGSDNLTNTYSIGNGHQAFSFNVIEGHNILINASTAPSINLEEGLFNATALWDADFGGFPIWVALVHADQVSFTGRLADFEILLPVRTHRALETYYVYVEVQ